MCQDGYSFVSSIKLRRNMFQVSRAVAKLKMSIPFLLSSFCNHLVAYASFAAIVCQKMNDNIILGRRIGQLGLKMLDQSESYMSELPLVYVLYYGSVGIFFEPIQSVIEMHRKAAEVGYQLGSLSLSAMHKVFQVAREFHSGKNLLKMKEDTERDTKSEEYHTSFPLLGMKLHAYHKAVTTLMGESIPEEPDKSQVFDSEPSVSTCAAISRYLRLLVLTQNT